MASEIGRSEDLPAVRAAGASLSSSSQSPNPTLAQQDLSYDSADTTSWKNWPDEVLSQLRGLGLAPKRLDACTAGVLFNKRRPSGLYYRVREGWYCGTDGADRQVFVRITAQQSMAKLAGPGTRLAPQGGWSIATRVWPLREGLRIPWTAIRGSSDKSSVPGSSTQHASRSLNMPNQFTTVLMGIPDEMQRCVIDGIDFESGRPWSSAQALGWQNHSEGCSHDGACEHISLAVVSATVVLVLDVKKSNRSTWSGWASRWEATEELDSTNPAIGSSGHRIITG
jgi:hypothetical protein